MLAARNTWSVAHFFYFFCLVVVAGPEEQMRPVYTPLWGRALVNY